MLLAGSDLFAFCWLTLPTKFIEEEKGSTPIVYSRAHPGKSYRHSFVQTLRFYQDLHTLLFRSSWAAKLHRFQGEKITDYWFDIRTPLNELVKYYVHLKWFGQGRARNLRSAPPEWLECMNRQIREAAHCPCPVSWREWETTCDEEMEAFFECLAYFS